MLAASPLFKAKTPTTPPSTSTNTTTNSTNTTTTGVTKAVATPITNPVICIQAGQAVLFSVDSAAKSYPVYMKDSILNTNPQFDYGQFLKLQTTINQGSTVTAFSFVFTEAGVYVFQDSVQTTKVTIIGVVAATQQCSNKDTNVQAVTAASLASIGIASQAKTVQPRWAFIIGTFVFILLTSFGFVNLVIVLHARNEARSSQSDSNKNHIYYDRTHELDKEHARQHRLCCRRGEKLEQVAPTKLENQDPDITYDELQQLLKDFRDQMEVLKAKLKEEEAGQQLEEQEAPAVDEEEELINELAELREFVNNNKECIEDFFGIKRAQEQLNRSVSMQSDDEDQEVETAA